MSHLTRCPNCSTAFRVTETQLAAYQGKVRCGKCAFVFNAPDFLIQTEILATPQIPEEELASQLTPESTPEPAQTQPPAWNIPVEISQPDLAQDADDFTLPEIELPDLELASHPGANVETAPESEKLDYRPIAMPEDEALFAPLNPKKSSWWWSIPALLAVIALLAQLIYLGRTRITMELPGLRPGLVSACQALGCTIPLPRRGEQLRSEWSELSYIPDHPNLIQLSATLRNLAGFEQAIPMLELSLTDENENVLARRLFRPQDYLTATEKQRKSLLAGEELHAYLQLDLGKMKSSGYSIFWIYE